MPTYGYRCPACSTEFDVWQKMTDEAAASCPSCGKPARRQFFPAGIVFKGSGFYATDSRKAAGSAANPAGANGKSDGKADGKSAATSDGKSGTKAGAASDGAASAPASSSGGRAAESTKTTGTSDPSS